MYILKYITSNGMASVERFEDRHVAMAEWTRLFAVLELRYLSLEYVP